MKLKQWYPIKMIKCSKGYTLIESLISLGLIFIMVFAVSALALGFSRYQTSRLERSLVQENFRYVVSIISEEVQSISFPDILEPENEKMSFELYLKDDSNDTIIRYHIVNNVGGSTESQVFRKVYNIPYGEGWKNRVLNASISDIKEDEPVSDKIKAVSHLLFTQKIGGVAIFITGETAKEIKVTYVSQVFPRN